MKPQIRKTAISAFAAASLLLALTGSSTAAHNARHSNGGDLREGGLWKVHLADGAETHTHGPDSPTATPVSLGATKASVVCVPANQKHFEVILARAADDIDRSDLLVEPLRQAVYDASSFMDSEAKSVLPTAEARYRVLCDAAGDVTINNVELPTKMADDNFSTIVDDLRTAPLDFDSSLAKYLIYYDDCAGASCSTGGQGSINNDDRASANNWNNIGPDYAIDYGGIDLDLNLLEQPNWSTLLHESGHNMGAVQLSAPHSSGYNDALKNGHHCNDGLDIMCYDDRGDKSNYSPAVCPIERFDCNKDDYFNPTPAQGTYLATHWNLAGSYNEFLYPKTNAKGKGGGKPKR